MKNLRVKARPPWRLFVGVHVLYISINQPDAVTILVQISLQCRSGCAEARAPVGAVSVLITDHI